MVGVRGLEPPASTSRTWRATDCATPRQIKKLCHNINLSVPNAARYQAALRPDSGIISGFNFFGKNGDKGDKVTINNGA